MPAIHVFRIEATVTLPHYVSLAYIIHHLKAFYSSVI